MKNKNTPETVVNSPELEAPRSKKNWNSVHTWTTSPGICRPVKSWDLPKNANVYLSPVTRLETMPTVGPLYGHYLLRYDYFFLPYRLYVPSLNNDNVNELSEVEDIRFPMLGLNVQSLGFDEGVYPYIGKNMSRFSVVSHGHLLTALGYPSMTLMDMRISGDEFENDNDTYNWQFSWIGAKGPVRVTTYDGASSDLADLYGVLKENNLTPSVFAEMAANEDYDGYLFYPPYAYFYNAVPFLGYIDIFMNYIANPSENFVYTQVAKYSFNVNNDSFDTNMELCATPFKVMQGIVPAVRSTGVIKFEDVLDSDGTLHNYRLDGAKVLPDFSKWADVYSSAYLGLGFFIERDHDYFNPFFGISDFSGTDLEDVDTISTIVFAIKVLQSGVDSGQIYNHEGMFLVPYLPDYFSTWLDPDDVDISRNVQSDSLHITSIRLAERKWADYARQLSERSKRYTSWLDTAYGVNGPKLHLDTKPIFVGSDTLSIKFQSIESTAETNDSTYTGSLGASVSKAQFVTQSNDVKPIKFTTQEPGMLMCVSYIVPEVSYGSGVDKFLLKERVGDLYRVPYDAIGFETIDSRELDASCSNPAINIGWVPAWYEYMTKVNTHNGLFSTSPFRSWLLSRETLNSVTFTNPGLPRDEDDPWYLDNSTYIDPAMFSHSFVNVGQNTDNFFIQTRFGFDVKLPMSNQLINTRW